MAFRDDRVAAVSAHNARNAALNASGAATRAVIHASCAHTHIGYENPTAALASLTSAHVAALELIEAIAKAKEELK